MNKEIITQEMINEFNQGLANSGAIFRLFLQETNVVEIYPANYTWLYGNSGDGKCIINLSDEFYSYLETFFKTKDKDIVLHYNNTRSTFWAYPKHN